MKKFLKRALCMGTVLAVAPLAMVFAGCGKPDDTTPPATAPLGSTQAEFDAVFAKLALLRDINVNAHIIQTDSNWTWPEENYFFFKEYEISNGIMRERNCENDTYDEWEYSEYDGSFENILGNKDEYIYDEIRKEWLNATESSIAVAIKIIDGGCIIMCYDDFEEYGYERWCCATITFDIVQTLTMPQK